MVIDTRPGTGWGSGNVGVYAAASQSERSVIKLGEKGLTGTININVHDDAETENISIGLWARGRDEADYSGGLIEVNSETLNVTGRSEHGWIYGIYAQNATTDAKAEKASIIINAENTKVDVSSGVQGSSAGIVAMSQGYIEINGNLEVNADNAIVARGNATVLINKNQMSTVRLNGNIDFNYDKNTSGTVVDADVQVFLAGEQSYWKGSPVVSYGTGVPPEDFDKVSGMVIGLSDGATWLPAVVAESETQQSGVRLLAINKLFLDGGIIALSEDIVNAGQPIDVESMEGTGGTIRTYVLQNPEGTISAGRVKIGTLLTQGAINVVADNITADDVSDVGGTLSALAGVVEVSAADAATSQIGAVIKEGDVLGELTQVFDAKGNALSEVARKENTQLSSFASVNVINLMQWRHEMNDLHERMGELRMSPQGIGSWVRVYGSSQKYGARGTETKNTSIQGGSDFDVGAGWKIGAAFSYTDSSSTMNNGGADGDMYGFALYGSWLNDDGQFVDLIAKYSRISTDFSAGAMAGGYDNNAYSLSAEYGWHINLNDMSFVEPQIEMTYGQVVGDDFTASNAVHVEQEDMESLIGRVGLRAGLYFPEKKGTIYARASVLHDFKGDSAFTASKGDLSSSLTEDLGGTWYEFGVGANFNLTPSTYTYVDLEKTTGGEVQEVWRWNIGLRHVW